jgi:hypothetical protein
MPDFIIIKFKTHRGDRIHVTMEQVLNMELINLTGSIKEEFRLVIITKIDGRSKINHAIFNDMHHSGVHG